MTFLHWIQAIWAASLGVVFAQMFFLTRQSKRLKKASTHLEIVTSLMTELVEQYEIRGRGEMQYSEAGLSITKHFEGLKLTSYQDQGGTWTIGYGHTATAKPGQTITEQEADFLLRQDVKVAEQCVNRAVLVPINQNQYDALVDFTFNLGCGRLRSSTMLGHVNRSNFEGAAQEFKRWKFIGRTESAGLVRRRAQNEATFRTPVTEGANEDASRQSNR